MQPKLAGHAGHGHWHAQEEPWLSPCSLDIFFLCRAASPDASGELAADPARGQPQPRQSVEVRTQEASAFARRLAVAARAASRVLQSLSTKVLPCPIVVLVHCSEVSHAGWGVWLPVEEPGHAYCAVAWQDEGTTLKRCKLGVIQGETFAASSVYKCMAGPMLQPHGSSWRP